MSGPRNLLALSLAVLLGATIGPLLTPHLSALTTHPLITPHLTTLLSRLPFLPTPVPPPAPPSCPPSLHRTTILSLSPLLLLLTNFTTPSENTHLIDLATPLLTPSPLVGASAASNPQARTSWSAPLPLADTTVTCLLARARSVLGSVLVPGRDDMGGAPQLVRYTPGQKFDVHTDWFRKPRVLDEDRGSGRRRMYNRVATVFVVVQSNCSEGSGETWFPRVKAPAPGEGGWWREHEEGGVAVRAAEGNALLWVNLEGETGRGDERVVHAGLEVVGGTKHAVNIWPRVFFGPDA
ncbi:hypothetical protein QBC39DRAFT_252166 [Podospora conica]|nr:hypothetical protein QBC39DRAFT_252166 [Schizothecium conicum]